MLTRSLKRSLRRAMLTPLALAMMTGPVTPPVSNAPQQAWRLPINSVVDSQGDTTLQTAFVNSAAALSFPSYTIANGATRSMTFDLPAVAAPGGLIYFIYDQVVTITAEVSTDGGTTWTALPYSSLAWNGAAQANIARRGQQVALEAGPARKVRFTMVNNSGYLNTTYLKIHQRPATGKADAWVLHGASLEDAMGSIELYNEWKKQFPSSDPVWFSFSQGGQTSNRIRALVDQSIAQIPWVPYYLYDVGGNDVTGGRPYVEGSTTLPNFAITINNIKAAGCIPLICSISYRNYVDPNAVDGVNHPENGSLPYDLNLIYPVVASLSPENLHPVYQTTHMDAYSIVLRYRELLADQVHFTDSLRLNQWIPEHANTAARFIYTNTWPVHYAERFVIEVENRTSTDYQRCIEVLDGLPATAGRAALYARMQATAVVPANNSLPTLSGSFAVDSTVMCSNGAWAGFPAPQFTYQWYADGVAISGATTNTYQLTTNELGKVMTCRATGTNAKGSAYAITAGSAPVTASLNQDPLTAALLGRMTTQPSTAQANKIDSLMKVLKTLNLSSFYMFAAHDSQAALLDWIRTTTSATLSATAPVFTPLAGFKGDGTAAFITTGINLLTLANYTQNNASLGYGIKTFGTGSIVGMSGAGSQVYNGTANIARLNCAGTPTGIPNFTAGNYIVTRVQAADFTLRKGQAARVTGVGVSTTIVSESVTVHRAGVSGFGTHQISHFWMGPALTAEQELTLDAAITAYLA